MGEGTGTSVLAVAWLEVYPEGQNLLKASLSTLANASCPRMPRRARHKGGNGESEQRREVGLRKEEPVFLAT